MPPRSTGRPNFCLTEGRIKRRADGEEAKKEEEEEEEEEEHRMEVDGSRADGQPVADGRKMTPEPDGLDEEKSFCLCGIRPTVTHMNTFTLNHKQSTCSTPSVGSEVNKTYPSANHEQHVPSRAEQ
ncbi:uncharacterized [Tachysurus ichikawai]